MLRKTTRQVIVILLLTLVAMGWGGANSSAAPQDHGEITKQEHVVSLEAQTTKQFNTFFSNFSEAGVQPFIAGQIPQTTLIDFGVLHNIINCRQVIQNGKISAREVDNACQKYFDIKTKKHQSTSSYRYANGYYTVPQASGEAYWFSQIVKLVDHGDGTFIAMVNVFVASSGFTGNPHETLDEWKASGEVPELAAKMKALIKKVSENGLSRWVLVNYQNQD